MCNGSNSAVAALTESKCTRAATAQNSVVRTRCSNEE